MGATIIHIELEAVDKRLKGGKLWMKGWGDFDDPNSPTCLHGAIRYCQPVPGDAYIIEQVGARFGFGIRDNDELPTWTDVRASVQPDITDDMLAETLGPQWEQIVALVRRAAVLTVDEMGRLDAARDDAWAATRAAARDAAWAATWAATWAAARDDARAAARDAAWDAARDAARDAAWDAARDAARALVMRDLIGQHEFTQEHYDSLVSPWVSVIGPVHPDDK